MRCSELLFLSLASTILVSSITSGDDPPPETKTFRLPFSRAAPDGENNAELPGPPPLPFSRSAGDWSHAPPAERIPLSFYKPDPERPFVVGGARVEPGRVISLLKGIVVPSPWFEPDHGLEVEGETVVVSHRPAVLDQIARLIERLESGAPPSVRMEVASVPVDALDAVAPGWRDDKSFPWLPGDALRRAVAKAGSQARYVSWTAASGERKRVSPPRLHPVLADYEVNQTGVIPVENPEISLVPEGFHVDARPLVSPSGAWVRIDLRAGDSLYLGRERRRLPHGELDLPRGKRSDLATSVIAPAGRTTIAGFLEVGRASDETGTMAGFAILARARPAPQRSGEKGGEAEEGASAERFAAVDLGCILAPFDLPFPASPDKSLSLSLPDENRGPRPIEPATLVEFLVSRGMVENEYAVRFLGNLAVVDLHAGNTAALRRSLEELARDTLRPVTVEVARWSLSSAGAVELVRRSDARPPNGAPPEKGGEGPQETATHRARLVMIPRLGGWLAALRHRSYLADLEKVSGGSTGRIIEASDPIVRSAGEGIIVALSLGDVVSRDRLSAGGLPTVPLRLAGEVLGPPDFPRPARVLANEQETLEPARTSDSLRDPEQSLDLDLPRESSEPLRAELAAALGRTTVLEVGPDEVTPKGEELPEGAENASAPHRVLTVRVQSLELPEEE